MSDGTSDQHPDLVGLMRGELSTTQVLAAEDHVRACGHCRQDLLDTVTGHALLARTSGVLGGVELPAPTTPLDTRTVRRRSRLGLVAAAAAVLVAGVGLGVGGAAVLGGQDDAGPGLEAGPSISAALGPVDADAGEGEVRMTAQADHSMRVTVRTAGLPAAPAGDFYYVWLLEPATNKMLPLGLVEPGGTATFRIAEELVAEYGAVDVSLEVDDGDPAHSVTSVLRGAYELT